MNENVDYSRVYVRTGVVSSALRAPASEALLARGLLNFVPWLQGLLTLPDNSTAWGGSIFSMPCTLKRDMVPCFNTDTAASVVNLQKIVPVL